jgi:hypothetical protein
VVGAGECAGALVAREVAGLVLAGMGVTMPGIGSGAFFFARAAGFFGVSVMPQLWPDAPGPRVHPGKDAGP